MRQILQDSREKLSWNFPNSKIVCLKTGDYTLEGLEHIFTIDRKATTSEFAHNITEKRFANEIERLRLMKYPFIVCEFDYADIEMFPHGSTIPKYLWAKIKVKPAYLKKKIAEYQAYGINVMCAGRFGREAALAIMREVERLES